MAEIVIDDYDTKWIKTANGKGIIAFNEDGNKKKMLEGGNLYSYIVHSIAHDFDGEIWIGTDDGIEIIYDPENVFFGNIHSEQILAEQGGHYSPLLKNETVTAIAVDGANRKWLGTEKAGVFLVSDDGTEVIENFTEDNSPLLSNSIASIAINQDNGEVFFGTSEGIISFKGTATEGFDSHSDVYAYPNPVKPGYNGTIAVKGLVSNADVKITDISGNIVYECTAFGGQAIWNGKNFDGEKVHSGVYLVFSSNEDGTETMVTKIMFIN